jgi:DNA-binding MarR family transcriptional regulator
MSGEPAAAVSWESLLSNRGRALLFIKDRPDATLRELSLALGVTERTAFNLVRTLERSGWLRRSRLRRRCRYEVNLIAPPRPGWPRQPIAVSGGAAALA